VRFRLIQKSNQGHQGEEKSHAYGSNAKLTDGLTAIAPPKKPIQHRTQQRA
jgi:hypothetical protein